MLNARQPHVLDLGAPEEVDEERLEPLELCLGRVREWFPGKCETRLRTAGDFTVFEFLNITTCRSEVNDLHRPNIYLKRFKVFQSQLDHIQQLVVEHSAQYQVVRSLLVVVA